MNITEFCIRRPAFTIVLSLLLTLIGLIAYQHLPLRWIPNVSPPVVSIDTFYPGADSSLVESQVTTPIESALASVDGVSTLSSTSKQGESHINLTFKLGHNMNTAVEDARGALQTISGNLPESVKMPMVSKMDADAEAIMYLAFLDHHRSLSELSDYVQQFIVPRLETVDGVASVLVYGDRSSVMHIWLDPKKMAAFNVSVGDINTVLMQQNIQIPSGQIRGNSRFYSVVTNETLSTPEQFNNLIIRDNQNQVVRLKDIGEAKVDAANTDSTFRVHGRESIALGIIPQSMANPLSVTDQVMQVFQEVTKTLPQGMTGEVAYEEASFIRASVQNVYEALLEAIFLVAMVIFLFLAHFRATLIPIITIPICLISVFGLFSCFDFSINTITLMALVLAIGLVVDDAIVMLENITRHIELGLTPFEAAIKGSREIIFPIIAMTLTLAAVYLPIAFTGGILSSVFCEFAITLAGAVIISGFVALTLSPMMCSRFLTEKKSQRYSRWSHTQFLTLQHYYQLLVAKILVKKKWIILILVILGIIGFCLYHFIPTELAPTEDMGSIEVYVTAPRDASFDYTDQYTKQLEMIYDRVPEMKSYFTNIMSWSPSHAYQEVDLIPQDKRKRTTQEIADDLTNQVQKITGVQVMVSVPPSPLTSFFSGNGLNIAAKIMSSMNYNDLHAVVQQYIAALRKSPILSYVDSQLKWDGEEFQVNVNRDKAADMRVPMQNITDTISMLLAGRTVGYFEYGGKQYDVTMQMNLFNLANPNVISELYVRNNMNQMVPLSDLVSITETTSPEALPHFNRLRADTVFSALSPGYSLGNAVKLFQQTAKQILPDEVKMTFVGQAQDYLESNGKMNTTFLLALIFIYLVLVAQFESFIDPLIILLTVPFAWIGGLAALKLTGNTLNIYSDIGLVTLIGLITKHGILMTEFANRQRREGVSIHDAVIRAAGLRLRPILMTTAAMVLGALPLALASGSGAETRHQIGWVIVGGMLIGTFFSLIVVPVAYSYFAKFKRVTSTC